jgi:hypothetical protein
MSAVITDETNNLLSWLRRCLELRVAGATTLDIRRLEAELTRLADLAVAQAADLDVAHRALEQSEVDLAHARANSYLLDL